MRNGCKRAIPLDVLVEGRPPPSRRLKDNGDPAFERSRARAQLRCEQVLKELDSAQHEEDLLKRIHSIRIGRSGMPMVGLDEAIKKWMILPRRRELCERTVGQARSRWGKFIAFVEAKQPAARFLADVTPDTAEEYMATIAAQRVSAKAYNNTLVGLSSVFNMLRKKASLPENPFEGIPKKEDDSVGHTPFTPEDLVIIIETARKPVHSFVRSILIEGICTAMRRGDCCTLKWSAVDLDGGFITVKTSKTNGSATIPLFPLLAEEIRRQLPRKSEYVFPECAMMYLSNPDGISYRVEKVLEDAGYSDSEEPDAPKHRGELHAKRSTGIRRACIRGFHSFRVTWVTLALNAGVPMELVRKVTSHRTVEVVLERYFKPGREDFRRALAEKMPAMFSVQTDTPRKPEPSLRMDAVLADLQAMTAENWLSVRDRLVNQLRQAV
jgi:integrase